MALAFYPCRMQNVECRIASALQCNDRLADVKTKQKKRKKKNNFSFERNQVIFQFNFQEI